MNFLQQLSESKICSSERNLSSYSLRDIVDGAFLTMIALYIMKRSDKYAPIVKEYINKTNISNPNFSNFTPSSTDLRLFITVMTGNSYTLNEYLADKKANAVLMDRIWVHTPSITKFLRMLQDSRYHNAEDKLLLDFEDNWDINVSNYISCRRLAIEWYDLNTRNKQNVVTRLLQAFRSTYKRMDIVPYFESYAREFNLERSVTRNAETGQTYTSSGGGFLKSAGMGFLAGLAGAAIFGKKK